MTASTEKPVHIICLKKYYFKLFMPPISKGAGAPIFWDCPSACLSIHVYPTCTSRYRVFGKIPTEGKARERLKRVEDNRNTE